MPKVVIEFVQGTLEDQVITCNACKDFIEDDINAKRGDTDHHLDDLHKITG